MGSPRKKTLAGHDGFTLIELIVVMLLVGITAGTLFMILQGPMRSFVVLPQRANLVDIAETALQRMTREIRFALPNSVRVSGGTALEFLRTLDGGRYRAKGANRLKFNQQADTFEFLGPLNNWAAIGTGGTGQADCMAANSAVDCMIVFNTGQVGANAYNGDNIAAITAKTALPPTTLSFNLSPVTRFPFPSPRQRFFVVDTPVSFICSGAQITRYADYLIQAAQPVPPAGGTANLLIDQLTACSIDYDPGTATRSGLVTISLTIRDNTLNQQVTLMQQAHVDNQP